LSYRIPLPDVQNAQRHAIFERDGELCRIGEDRFILANIELPIAGSSAGPFVWTCWISLSQTSYDRFKASWKSEHRHHEEPAFGWLLNHLPTYEPSTLLIKARVHNREIGMRPRVELEPTAHPLSREQAEGITSVRITQLYHLALGHSRWS